MGAGGAAIVAVQKGRFWGLGILVSEFTEDSGAWGQCKERHRDDMQIRGIRLLAVHVDG